MTLDADHSTVDRHRRIVIVGGGITGLAAAYRLHTTARRQAAPLVVVVLESSERPGGMIRTERVDGFTVEAGPDIFLARKPRGAGLCRDLGLADQLMPTNPDRRGSYVQRGGRLYRLPEGLSGLVPTRLGPMLRSPLLSPGGKLRMAMDWLLPARPGDADESVGAFITRRLGRQAYENLVEPLLGGIYGADGHELSLKATFPQLRDLERAHGSLIRGLLKEHRARPASPESAFLTLRDGLGALIDGLVTRLDGVRLRTGCTVAGIERDEDGFRVRLNGGEALAADAVLVTTPAYVAALLVETLDPTLAGELRAIPYGSVATLTVAFDAADVPRPLDAYGYVVPRVEARPVLACTWTSTKIPPRAPDGTVLLRVFLGRAGDDALIAQPDDALLATALAELKATLGITTAPLFHRLYRWSRSMPQYVLGHPERVERIGRRAAAHPGLFLAGAAYRGVGLPDCIHDGEQAAQQAWAFVFEHPAPSLATPG